MSGFQGSALTVTLMSCAQFVVDGIIHFCKNTGFFLFCFFVLTFGMNVTSTDDTVVLSL